MLEGVATAKVVEEGEKRGMLCAGTLGAEGAKVVEVVAEEEEEA